MELQEESIKEGPIYFLTWNPKPKFYIFGGDEDHKYNYQWTLMLRQLLKLARCSNKFVIVPEIGDLGKLHCHGWFYMKDKIKWTKSVLPSLKKFGFIKLNKATVINKKSFKYYKKDLSFTKCILTDFNTIVYTPDTYSYMHDMIRFHDYNAILTQKDITKVKKKNVMEMLDYNGFLKDEFGDSDSDN